MNEVDVIVYASKLSATVYNAKIDVIRYIRSYEKINT